MVPMTLMLGNQCLLEYGLWTWFFSRMKGLACFQEHWLLVDGEACMGAGHFDPKFWLSHMRTVCASWPQMFGKWQTNFPIGQLSRSLDKERLCNAFYCNEQCGM